MVTHTFLLVLLVDLLVFWLVWILGSSVMLVSDYCRDLASSHTGRLSDEGEPNFSPNINLFVCNLPFTVNSAVLIGFFGRAGNVEMVEATSVGLKEQEAIDFLEKKMRNDSAFSYDKTHVQIAISALQSILQEDFKPSEIEDLKSLLVLSPFFIQMPLLMIKLSDGHPPKGLHDTTRINFYKGYVIQLKKAIDEEAEEGNR